MRLLCRLFAALMSFAAVLAIAQSPPPTQTQTIITLNAGTITGLQFHPNLFKFLGIRYAQPPIGNGRFASPVAYPADNLPQPFVPGPFHSDHSINATAYGNMCPQSSGGAEDCLFLNVFTTTVSSSALRPVMFWIHGGSFVEGTGSNPLFDGSALANNDVVVVTFNYRLGIFGFLDGGHDFPTVNMGLQDTQLALMWVQNNIVSFGGDPSRVTVFGESSGGTMIRALMSSPKSKGLFKRVIIQSDPQSYPLESRNVSRDIVGAYALSQLGCSTVECARSLSVSAIVAATENVTVVGPSLNPSIPVTPLSPTIDGTWIIGDFSKLIGRRSLPMEVDILMGTVLNEATPEIFELSPVPLPDSSFQYIMALFIGPTRSAAVCACPEFALNQSDPDTVRKTLSRVGTLFFWTCAVQANAIAYANQANVYLYELLLGCTHPDNANDPLCVGEVCHQDDIPMVFGTCPSPTSQQTALSNEIITRWTAFAANGKPDVPGIGKPVWNKVEGPTNLNILRLSPTDVVNQTLYSDLCGPVFGNTVPFNFQLY